MALGNFLDGDVRDTSSSENNSGFFDRSSGGLDFTQQDAPHVIIDNSTVTASTSGASDTVTLAGAYTVAAHDVGNTTRWLTGTNVLADLYRIIAVNTGANTWQFDRNLTTGTSTNLTGRMGGAVASPGQAAFDVNSHNLIQSGIYIKKPSGSSYLLSNTANVSGGKMSFNLAGLGRVEGFLSAHGDQAAVVRLEANASFMHILTMANGAGARISSLEFFRASGGGLSGVAGIDASGTDVLVQNCLFTNLNDGGDGGVGCNNTGTRVRRCFFNTCALAINIAANQCSAYKCVAINSTGTPFTDGGVSFGGNWSRCQSLLTSGPGFSLGAPYSLTQNCTAALCTGDGFAFSVGDLKTCQNCLSWGNGTGGSGFGFKATGDVFLDNCAAGGNHDGDTSGFDAFHKINFISVTNNPFVNSGGSTTDLASAFTNFLLNSDPVGGLLLAGTGDPTFLDIGACQTQSTLLAPAAAHKYAIGRRSF
jgi:hypothetical protein